MKAHLLVAIAAGCGLAACHIDPRFAALAMHIPPRGAPPARAALEPVTTYQLANGLRVAIVRDPDARLASVDLRYEAGAADDPPDRPGLALELAHAIADAPLGAPDVELTRELAVGLDRIDLTTTTLPEALDGALELAARRLELACSALSPELVARARAAALADAPARPPTLPAVLWGAAHPYAHPIAGPELAAATADELCRFDTAHLAPAAATLVVVAPHTLGLLSRIRTRFERIPRRAAAPRAPIEPVQAAPWRTVSIPGLARPAALLVFPAPGPEDADAAIFELAVRRLEEHGVHALVTGGERARALVLARDAKDPAQLAAAEKQLLDDLEIARTRLDDDLTFDAHDRLAAAEALEDPFTRGAAQARILAAGQPPDRARDLDARAAAPGAPADARTWLLDHLSPDRARRLALVPLGPPADLLDDLVQPAGVDARTSPAEDVAPVLPASAPRAAPIVRTLGNGLRVVLAPQPGALTVDLRLVIPAGTRDEPAPGLALRAAAERSSDDGWSVGQDAAGRLAWYEDQDVESDVDVGPGWTRFHAVGFAALTDWHVFALGWLVTTGHYASGADGDALARFARAAYRPAGATLIVSGGFDPDAAGRAIATWLGGWHAAAVPAPHPRPAQAAPPHVVAQPGPDDAVEALLELPPRDAATDPAERARRLIVASIVARRLAATARGELVANATYDPARDRLAIALQLDPAAAGPLAQALRGELAALAATGPTAGELASARREVIAALLADDSSAVGRGRLLERAVEIGAQGSAAAPGSALDDELVHELAAARDAALPAVRASATALLPATGWTIDARGPREPVELLVRGLGVSPAEIRWQASDRASR